ncbi:baseplate J/gp47 family protein [Pseudoalteromonas sp. SR44-5]|uniref:baseplate J/gp47 family protein n=1 Tax=Pseudoalteromonas sp. SR44-5 TaxID=2760934 RepID=UPI00160453D0|nr:baseplate J/gp47 family protein [Pseudoalteromonas sp. SR44-5]MBB1368658.1 baseplate J/gp47 family protein [Pseudoalteromonas sp. SR44-5]
MEFKTLMQKAGLPLDEQTAQTQWQAQLKKQNIQVANNSPFGPFWRTVEALITKPVVQLFNWIATQLMPDLFIMTASRTALIERHGPARNVFIQAGVKAQGILTFRRSNTEGETSIVAGTQVVTDMLGDTAYMLALLQDVYFSDGQRIAYAHAEATDTGAAFNLPAHAYRFFIEQQDGITVTNNDDWLIKPGSDDESTEHYRLRIRNVFGTAARWHINAVYKQIIASFAVPIDNIVIEVNAPRGPGTANAYIYLDVGPVPTALLSAINQHIRTAGHHGLGDDFMVYAMATTGFNITATYKLHDNSQAIQSDLTTFIQAAFRQNAAYAPTRVAHQTVFSISQLITECHEQFSQLKSIKFDIDDITSANWLPVLTSLTVNEVVNG